MKHLVLSTLFALCTVAFPAKDVQGADRQADSHTPSSGEIQQVEQWDLFEVTLRGPSEGNPFVDVNLSARFTCGDQKITVPGFYDGNGIYRIRFSPPTQGAWRYQTSSNREQLDAQEGECLAVAPTGSNHGPVQVWDTYFFRYADGTPYFQVGTTCYAWAHQGDAMEEQTLATLKNAPFNKMRMCVFPKSYTYNQNEPQYYAYEGTPPKDWDFTRFNPEFWRHFEKRVGQLRDLGIEADIILWHPYDRWGFAEMGREHDERYLRYAIARLGAYRNVWWSLANEYDLMAPDAMAGHRGDKEMTDWDNFFQILQKEDVHQRLRGIHNCRGFYDHSHPWVTHVSVQNWDLPRVREWRQQYKKPVVVDECGYEGNVPQGWGNLTAQELVRRFWIGMMNGGSVGHGETYQHPEEILWWSKGGVLHGQSPVRIQFLKEIIEGMPFQHMPPDYTHHPAVNILAQPGKQYLIYFTEKKPVTLDLPGDRPYKLDIIDPWEMKVWQTGSVNPGQFHFMPPKQDSAIRLTLYSPGEKIRPTAQATADQTEGIAPLKVRFSTPWKQQCYWDFGDLGHSTESSPTFTFEQPGVYTVVLTVTDSDGNAGSSMLPIFVDRRSDEPVVRFGFADGNHPQATLHGGEVTRTPDGAYDLGNDAPFSWIQVGEAPLTDLEGAQSFTVMGWLNAANLQVGAGGNRILFSLQNNRSGIDIVHHADGRLRLAVNEWPDAIENDSSPGKVEIGKWLFFAVTYDATKESDSVCWYFGDENTPAQLDRKTNYTNGPVGEGSGDLVIGNFNKTLQGAGLDRQFRGQIRALQIFASRIGTRGALPLERIQELQKK
ncbi:MAG: DUF5060 domain-containing protein [bacterium]|jgi:PKD repeat protein|nr:DUF5060 domain-containing protein [bacterium]